MDAQTASPSQDERTFALLAHLGGLLTGFIVPLVIWLIKNGDSDFAADQAKEALNFQITLFIAYLVCMALMLVLIGVFLLPIVGLAHLILTIVAAIKSYGGERYRYPFTLRLVS